MAFLAILLVALSALLLGILRSMRDEQLCSWAGVVAAVVLFAFIVLTGVELVLRIGGL